MPELARKKIRPVSRFCSRQIKVSRTASARGSSVRRNWRMCFEPATRNWPQPPMTSRFSISTCVGLESGGAPSSICFRKVSPLAQGWPLRTGLLRKDRKSTRLNSSHMSISYAVFCLKKKKKKTKSTTDTKKKKKNKTKKKKNQYK